MPDSVETISLHYTRHLLKDVLGWYKRAEFKAQLLLTLNGVFVTFLATAIVRSPKEFSSIPPNQLTILKLLLMGFCFCRSISPHLAICQPFFDRYAPIPIIFED